MGERDAAGDNELGEYLGLRIGPFVDVGKERRNACAEEVGAIPRRDQAVGYDPPFIAIGRSDLPKVAGFVDRCNRVAHNTLGNDFRIGGWTAAKINDVARYYKGRFQRRLRGRGQARRLTINREWGGLTRTRSRFVRRREC